MSKGTSEIFHSGGNFKPNIKQHNQKRRRRRFRLPEKYKFFADATWETSKLFCFQTAMHGFRYVIDESEINRNITDARGPWYSKLLTKIIFLISITFMGCGCLYMMFLVYERYDTNPTVTSIETNNYPIFLVPFPAVTFCNINKVYGPHTDKFVKNLLETGIEQSSINDFFNKLSALINPETLDGVYLKIYVILESMGYDSERLMEELSQPCENLLKKCLWLGKEWPCRQLFRKIEASEGFCCSFNYHEARAEFNILDDGNESRFFQDDLLYVNGAGKSVGLSILLDPETEYYTSVTRPYFGVEIMVHHPTEQPAQITAVAQPGNDINIMVLPSVVVSEPAIRDLPLTQRHCYFSDERKLRNADLYSFQSCMLECKVDTILELCSCIPFFYPETKLKLFSKNFRQCSLRDVNCLRNNRYIFNSLASLDDNRTAEAVLEDGGMHCNCYPTCSEQQYPTNVLVGKRLDAHIITSVFGNDFFENRSGVHVFFKDFTCVKYRRDVYMTWDTLFASFGGIFGLCLGGSVLSIIEFIYAYTFKLWFMIYSERERRVAASRFSVQMMKSSGGKPPSYSNAKKQNIVEGYGYSKKNPFSYSK